jgi:hypothetical protein
MARHRNGDLLDRASRDTVGAAVAFGLTRLIPNAERRPDRCRTLNSMSYIPTLVASLDARLDELAVEISTLADALAALLTTSARPAATAAQNGAARKRSRRQARPTTAPAAKPTSPATDPTPALATATRSASTSEAATPRRRTVAKAPKKRAVGSLSTAELERLLAESTSGLSARAIAERAGAGYGRVLSLLRELEVAGTVRRTGTRRSTLWLLITDEERIAQRAAELERLAAAPKDDRTQRRGRARAS